MEWIEVRWGVMLVCAGIGCWTDLTQHRIPNLLSGATVLAGLALFYLEDDIPGVFYALSGLCCAGGVMLFFYAMGGFGAGDVKLMGGLGSLAGFYASFSLLMYVAVVGGCMALLTLLRHGMFWRGLGNAFAVLLGHQPGTETEEEAATSEEAGAIDPARSYPKTIPYGVAILLGVCLAYLSGDVM